MESLERVGFDSEGSSVIVEKYANAHIGSEEYMVIDKIRNTITNGVETIGGKYLIQKGVGMFSWYWTDGEVKLHTKKFNIVL